MWIQIDVEKCTRCTGTVEIRNEFVRDVEINKKTTGLKQHLIYKRTQNDVARITLNVWGKKCKNITFSWCHRERIGFFVFIRCVEIVDLFLVSFFSLLYWKQSSRVMNSFSFMHSIHTNVEQVFAFHSIFRIVVVVAIWCFSWLTFGLLNKCFSPFYDTCVRLECSASCCFVVC